jgi:PqqD family protein of HPr-rel-A system
MLEDPALIWQLTDLPRTRVRRFGDEGLVFNPLSWETHLVRDPALRVVEVLASGPRREADLAAELASEDGEPDVASVRDRIKPLLDELRNLGLVSSRAEAP